MLLVALVASFCVVLVASNDDEHTRNYIEREIKVWSPEETLTPQETLNELVEMVAAIGRMSFSFSRHLTVKRNAEQLIALAHGDWHTVCNQKYFKDYNNYVENNNHPNIVNFIKNYGPSIIRLCNSHFPKRVLYFRFMQTNRPTSPPAGGSQGVF